MSRIAQLPPQSVSLVKKDGMIRDEWYKYLQRLHSWSGLMGSKFDIWEFDGGGFGQWENVSAGVFSVSGNLKTFYFGSGSPTLVSRGSCLLNGYTPGTDLYPMVLWMPDNGQGNQAVLEFEYGTVASESVFPASIVLSEVVDVPVVGRSATLTAFDVIPGAAFSPGDVVLQTIRRDTANPSDTSGDDVIVLWAGFAYQRSGHGTREKVR